MTLTPVFSRVLNFQRLKSNVQIQYDLLETHPTSKDPLHATILISFKSNYQTFWANWITLTHETAI